MSIQQQPQLVGVTSQESLVQINPSTNALHVQSQAIGPNIPMTTKRQPTSSNVNENSAMKVNDIVFLNIFYSNEVCMLPWMSINKPFLSLRE